MVMFGKIQNYSIVFFHQFGADEKEKIKTVPLVHGNKMETTSVTSISAGSKTVSSK
jgi:hypothetical protein